MRADNPRLFVLLSAGYDGSVLSRPIRLAPPSIVLALLTVRHLSGGVLYVALEGAPPDGQDWSEMGVWKAHGPGVVSTGALTIRYPFLRARLWVEDPRKKSVRLVSPTLAEFTVHEAPAAGQARGSQEVSA
ncbi:MAG: hypothetical protein FD180_2542 [Planctomycetota bacterium]|nr:MAG: hypothetical protein FD180_2542 [Planctomycetota bacterium]